VRQKTHSGTTTKKGRNEYTIDDDINEDDYIEDNIWGKVDSTEFKSGISGSALTKGWGALITFVCSIGNVLVAVYGH
jgi:hypothetical protein